MKINYLTTNKLKFKIAQNYFDKLPGVELVQQVFETPEIQAETCEQIAAYSAVFAAHQLGEPCVKMDAGFFIPALGGFPGPFVKYVNDWLSEEKYLALMSDEDDRSMYFEDVTAVAFADGTVKTFAKRYYGKMAEPGNYIPSKWPANSLFIPDGYEKPLGSMSSEEQEEYWKDGVLPEVVAYLSSHDS